MNGIWTGMAGVYAAGVLVGLVRTDGPPAARLGLAVLWPVGPLAFLATLVVLVAASVVPLSQLLRRR